MFSDHKWKHIRHQNWRIKNEEVKLEMNNEENNRILAKYFSRLLNCDGPPKKAGSEITKGNHVWLKAHDVDGVVQIIKDLKNNSLKGEDGRTSQNGKFRSYHISLFNLRIYGKWKMIPADCLMTVIHPLHKKGTKGDNNFKRKFPLLSHTRYYLKRYKLGRR